MKRRILFCLLLLVVVYLTGYAFYMISFRVTDPEHVVKAGKLDLTGYSFETADKPVFLAGEWDFFSGRLLSPEKIGGEPGAGKITVPGTFADSGYERFGCGTYHLQITVDEAAPALLFVKIPNMQHASKGWIDNEVVFEAGTPGETDEATVPKINVGVAAFEREGETIDMVVWVSNFHYYKSGINNPIELGTQRLITYTNMHRWAILAVVLGGMLAIGLFNIAIYYFRSKEKINLFFGLMCLAHFTRYAFGMMEIDSFLFRGVDENIKNLISGISLYLIIYYLARFSVCLLQMEKPVFLKILRITTAAIVLFSAFMPYSVFFMDIALFASRPLPLVVVVYLTYHMISAAKRLVHDIRIVFIVAFAVYIVSVLIEIKGSVLFHLPSFPAGLSLIVAQCIVLAHAYGNALTSAEKANLFLEEKVAKRTMKLRETNESLAASERRVKETVSGISHDLKTPMSVLAVNLEMALETELSPDNRRRLSIAYAKSGDLARLIADLLDIGRMEAGKERYDMAWMTLSSLLGGVSAKYDEQMEAADIALNVSYREDCRVWLDENHIWRVLDNLIGNALRYTPKGGTISVVSGRTETGFVTITVSDTGGGIAPEHLAHIFDRYYKADKARGAEGAGLGLYIVKTAVESMGGRVSVQSSPGLGARFSFSLMAEALSRDADALPPHEE